MEQHPVPQNITSFQFRLVGDMTLKQFGYLAGGIALAYISYKLPLPFFFRWPLTVTFALGGFGFAFVPIEERPMDIWVLSFIKNVYNPTVFHWEYTKKAPEPTTTPPSSPQKAAASALTDPMASLTSFFKTQTQAAPATQSASVVSALPVSSARKNPMDAFFSWIDSLFPTTKVAYALPTPIQRPAAPPPARIPTSIYMPTMPSQAPKTPPGKPEEKKEAPPVPQKTIKKTEEELTVIKMQLETVQKELSEKKLVESRVLELQKELSDISVQKQKMERELIDFKRVGAPPGSPFTKPIGTLTTKTTTEPSVQVMGKDAAIRAGIPRLTTFPNVITGIVKDYDTNLLPGVLVTVKDKEGIPLRALKTNKLGQFAASTPLPNGTYVVEVEDPRGRFLFDRMQVTLVGSVMPAVMVIAKSKRQLERDMLSKQIFGSPSANS